jgi:O-methyltransferase
MSTQTQTDAAVDLYLELLAKALTRSLYEDNDAIFGIETMFGVRWKERIAAVIAAALRPANIELVRKRPYDAKAREYGRDWPARAETMAGLRRLANARFCIESAINDAIPGDIIETGVWRGGTSIFMRGVLKAHQIEDRTVWCADSFEGLPAPAPEKYPADADLHLEQYSLLAVDVNTVRRNFARYDLLDAQVRFLVGWFKDTLPEAPIKELSVMRLDGDLYESTMQALDALYPRLSIGGYCIIDDYGNIDACKEAVHDYRRSHQITDEILDVDGYCVYWRRSG